MGETTPMKIRCPGLRYRRVIRSTRVRSGFPSKRDIEVPRLPRPRARTSREWTRKTKGQELTKLRLLLALVGFVFSFVGRSEIFPSHPVLEFPLNKRGKHSTTHDRGLTSPEQTHDEHDDKPLPSDDGFFQFVRRDLWPFYNSTRRTQHSVQDSA
jgi:hypothetical protein